MDSLSCFQVYDAIKINSAETCSDLWIFLLKYSTILVKFSTNAGLLITETVSQKSRGGIKGHQPLKIRMPKRHATNTKSGALPWLKVVSCLSY